MTVSAFSSVSAEPALVLCCVNGTADTLEGIDASQCFAVNVLTTTQQNIANQFAGGVSSRGTFCN
jgi:flavin reductase (DIM6/NTAB) family NADH-FMN oxidoreductase RutF